VHTSAITGSWQVAAALVARTDRLSDVLRGLAGRGSEIQNAATAMQNRPMINPLSVCLLAPG